MSKFKAFFKAIKDKTVEIAKLIKEKLSAAFRFVKVKTAPATAVVAKGATTVKGAIRKFNDKTGISKIINPASLDKRKARNGWLFVMPFVLGVLFLYLPVVIDSIWFSFNSYKYTADGLKMTFVGIQYYKDALLTDAGFAQTLLDGIKQLVFDVPAIVIFSLFIAVVLNTKMLGRAVFRAIFFVPVIIATGLMDSINIQDVLADQMGSSGGISTGAETDTTGQIVSAMDIQALFADMKVGTQIVTYVTQLVNDIYDIINRSGVQMLIFLAGLQSISPAIYEACTIDGATPWETFWKITFPMISPMILVNAIYTIIDSFTSKSNVVMTYIAEKSDMGGTISTAMSWIYFLTIMLIIGIAVALISSFVFYQKRD